MLWTIALILLELWILGLVSSTTIGGFVHVLLVLAIIQLIAEGKANKQAASVLGISIKTIEKHRQNLMNKLDLHDTAGLTRYAIAAGIIDSGVRFTIE